MDLRSKSGTSDTGRWHGCPCGRRHPSKARARKMRAPVDHGDLTARVYEAFAKGKVETRENRHEVHYSGNCESPIRIPSYSSRGGLFVITKTRCRNCPSCLKAKQFHWARLASAWTKSTHEEGRRTWFGTLTLSPEYQRELTSAAQDAYALEHGQIADWLFDPLCDERFALVRNELVEWCKRYWKRLRKGRKRCLACFPSRPRKAGEWDHPPASFKYMLVFERHRSGLPHMHWLLHEQSNPILKKHLQCEWPFGFTQVKLVKPDDGPRSVEKVGFYVAKYLGKAKQARQIASVGFAKGPTNPGRG